MGIAVLGVLWVWLGLKKADEIRGWGGAWHCSSCDNCSIIVLMGVWKATKLLLPLKKSSKSNKSSKRKKRKRSFSSKGNTSTQCRKAQKQQKQQKPVNFTQNEFQTIKKSYPCFSKIIAFAISEACALATTLSPWSCASFTVGPGQMDHIPSSRVMKDSPKPHER